MRADSDVDYQNALFGIPESEIAAREAEREREERWAEFVSWARHARPSVLLRTVSLLMEGQRDPFYANSATDRIDGFAETEGWDGVLSAIARAMREEEQFRRELVDRR